MAVLSPPSAARNLRKPENSSVQRGPNAHAPAVALPLRFILAGILALATGSVWLVVQPEILATYHYNQHVIAVTHLFVLGWICSVIMGAMYQLVPVALETPWHSERLARWHFGLHVVGFTGMVVMFQVWNVKQVGHFGLLLAIGAGLFVYNLARTLARIPRWNVVAAGIAASLFWLSVTILAGLYLAAAKRWNFSPFDPVAQMHAHAHPGGLGFFVMMIVAISYKLVPMFALSEVQSARRAAWSLVLLNAGLAGVFVTILLSSPWKFLFALIVLGGFAFYSLEMTSILRARKRRNLDWGLKYFVTAIALLLPVSALGVALAWPQLPRTMLTAQLENVYGFLAFIGVVTFAILGMLYKIVPFLVWFASYSNAIGRGRVPSLTDLYSPALQVAGYWLFVAGILLTSVATALSHENGVRIGCVVLLGSVTVFVVNIGNVLTHLVRPRIEPLIFKPAAEGNA
jgi:hypothetical protein